MDGHFKEVIDKVLKEQGLDVFLTVWRNLVLLVVQLAHRRPEIPVFLFYFLSLTLLLILLHIIIRDMPPLFFSKGQTLMTGSILINLAIFYIAIIVKIVIIITVMWGDKRYQDQPLLQNGSANFSKNHPAQTPKNKGKPNIPLPNSRRSVTPTRVQERVTTSPLRLPLERAI